MPWWGRLSPAILTQDFETVRLQFLGKKVVVALLDTLTCALHCSDAWLVPVSSQKDTTTSRYFPTMHHTLSGDLLRFWQAHGGESFFGASLTEVIYAMNSDHSGRVYTPCSIFKTPV